MPIITGITILLYIKAETACLLLLKVNRNQLYHVCKLKHHSVCPIYLFMSGMHYESFSEIKGKVTSVTIFINNKRQQQQQQQQKTCLFQKPLQYLEKKTF